MGHKKVAVYGNQNYTTFSGVNVKGSIALRVGGLDTYAGTLSIKGGSLDGARAWAFPDKSGTFPVMGSFSVQLPAAVAGWFSTIVTVSGITAEDSVIVNLREEGGAYVFGTQGTQYIHLRSQAGAGNITLFFQNLGNATGYIRMTGDYVAVR